MIKIIEKDFRSEIAIKRPPELAQGLTAACNYQHVHSNAFVFKQSPSLGELKNHEKSLKISIFSPLLLRKSAPAQPASLKLY